MIWIKIVYFYLWLRLILPLRGRNIRHFLSFMNIDRKFSLIFKFCITLCHLFILSFNKLTGIRWPLCQAWRFDNTTKNSGIYSKYIARNCWSHCCHYCLTTFSCYCHSLYGWICRWRWKIYVSKPDYIDLCQTSHPFVLI